jgi:hypothetical protein
MKWVFLLALGVAACGGNTSNNGNDNPKDAGAGSGSDASPPMQDAGTDAATSPFASCIDRPDQADSLVQRPPTAGLPCDLIPPAALH